MGDQRPLLRDVFFKPFMVNGNMEKIVQGLISGIDLEDRSQMPDAFIVEEVRGPEFRCVISFRLRGNIGRNF